MPDQASQQDLSPVPQGSPEALATFTIMTQREKQKLARAVVRAKDKARDCYKAAEEALTKLLEGGLKPGEIITIKPGHELTLRDNFAEGKLMAYKTSGIARFELVKPTKTDLRPKALVITRGGKPHAPKTAKAKPAVADAIPM